VRLGEAGRAGWSAPRLAAELAQEADEAVRKAQEIAGGRAETRVVNGPPAPALLAELAAREATLVALGTHGRSRAVEIMIGGVAGELLHRAPCSVLIARPPRAAGDFPHALVVGVDGSAGSAAAVAAGEYLARRFGAALRVVEAVDEPPVAALVAASRDADLLLVGSRGLTGWKALGSVSERVAHEAGCSVLVVRRS
jgi:nucleotide-binding universal stress UspA family protein